MTIWVIIERYSAYSTYAAAYSALEESEFAIAACIHVNLGDEMPGAKSAIAN
jgi:hypothetical protein